MALGALAFEATATELVYTPVNPSFGGNPLNGAYLLGNAQSQDDNKNPDALSRSATTTSALSRFTSQLESRLLSQLLTDVSDGKGGGSLTTNDFIVNIVDLDGMLTVQITDRLTGEMSEIIINGVAP
nr:curli assembly protein CsgF [Stutzerimonas nosocomialis]